MRRSATETFSIFGQIEDVAASILIENKKVTKIPLEQFPDQGDCPDIWTNEQGDPALYAIIVPRRIIPEFNKLIADLRA